MSGIYHPYIHNYSSTIGVEQSEADAFVSEVVEDFNFSSFNSFSSINSNIRDFSDHPRNLKLKFLYDINDTVYTGKTFEQLGISLRVALIDEATDETVRTGPESSLPVEILVLDKNFNQETFTTEEFDSFIVEADDGRKRKRSLLCNKPCLILREGLGSASEISFKHTNRHMKKCEFRLGARIAKSVINVIGIKEAKTNPFTVKDKRIMSEKIYPPSLDHEVWRVNNIAKDGAYHRRLKDRDINTVKDFLTEVNMNPDNLRKIMLMKSAKTWETTVKHAKTCVLCPDKYLYICPNSQPKKGVVFNIVKEILGLYSESTFFPIDQLSIAQKAFLRELMDSASEHSDKVVNFDNISDAPFEHISSLSSPDPNFSYVQDIYNNYGQCDGVGLSYMVGGNKKPESFKSDTMSYDHWGSYTHDYGNMHSVQNSPLWSTDQALSHLDPEDFLDNMFKEHKRATSS